MVRYDKCVENLYNNGVQMEDKTKTLNILKVMKGAISMSKSKTGECIFRNNKTEKTNLVQTIKRHRKDNDYNIARIDTNKKMLVGRWTKILDKQTAVSAQSLFEDMLDIQTISSTGNDAEENKLKSYIAMRLEKMEESIQGPKLVFKRGPRPRASEFLMDQRPDGSPTPSSSTEFISERKEIREKYTDDMSPTKSPRQEVPMQGAVLAKSSVVRLPNVGGATGRRRSDGGGRDTVKEEDEKRPPFVEEEKDLTDWKDWRLKDKRWILGYIHNEKTRHEDLIIRNALNKIENEMSGANTIKRHQIKQKLQLEKRREAKLLPITSTSSTLSSPRSQMTSSTSSARGNSIVRSVTFPNPKPGMSVLKKKTVKLGSGSDSDNDDEGGVDLPDVHQVPTNFTNVSNKRPSFVGQLPVIVEHPKTLKEKSLPRDMKVN